MKILLSTSEKFDSSYGGGQVYLKNLVDELVRQGIFPEIATPGERSEQQNLYCGCRIFSYDALQVKTDYRTLLPFLDAIKPDIVHAHGFKSPFARASKDLNIPCFVTAHHGGILCPAGALLNHRDEICGTKANPKACLPCVLRNIRGGLFAWPFVRLMPLSVRLLLGRIVNRLPFMLYITPVLQASLSIQKKAEEWQEICSNASLLIAPSGAIAESMELNGAPKDKIKVIAHGIPLPEPCTDHPVSYPEAGKPVRFFYVGRLCREKGVHVMLEAFDRLSGDAELHIIGDSGNRTEERYKQRLLKQYGHNRHITWHGKVTPEDVARTILDFDVMIHPAIYLEVYGLTIAEALASGKPVIATRCGGAEMQIQNNKNGFLITPNDPVELKDKMEYFIAHAESIEKFSRQIEKPVSIGKHVADLIDLYSFHK